MTVVFVTVFNLRRSKNIKKQSKNRFEIEFRIACPNRHTDRLGNRLGNRGGYLKVYLKKNRLSYLKGYL